MKFLKSPSFPILLGLAILFIILQETLSSHSPDSFTDTAVTKAKPIAGEWLAPDIKNLPNDERSKLVRFGRALIVNTAFYWGPKGTLAAITNGMNCQNCHLDAGSRPFEGCFSGVSATYPRFRERSGQLESVAFRVNDCLMRSLDGKPVDSAGHEMQAIVAYLRWIGKDVKTNKSPIGAGLEDLPFLDRAADPAAGEEVYVIKCTSCHGPSGQGVFSQDSSSFIYPPLWGPNSFNVSAGLYRITRLAAFIKSSMPYGIATHNTPQLTNEQAWDVAAFILSQPRPQKMFSDDWPKLESKPVDYPFGPYKDGFTEKQHKFGPFTPIVSARRTTNR